MEWLVFKSDDPQADKTKVTLMQNVIVKVFLKILTFYCDCQALLPVIFENSEFPFVFYTELCLLKFIENRHRYQTDFLMFLLTKTSNSRIFRTFFELQTKGQYGQYN